MGERMIHRSTSVAAPSHASAQPAAPNHTLLFLAIYRSPAATLCSVPGARAGRTGRSDHEVIFGAT